MDRVIIRRWNTKMDHGDLIAILPDNDANYGATDMYESCGGHGEGDYVGVVSQTSPVQGDELDVMDLLQELQNIGYEPKLMRRMNWYEHRKRWIRTWVK